jgi:phage shock protein PspC (stress-responsive transcriptional regulator)
MTATFVRSRDNVMIGGVCGGLGAFLGISPTYVRLFFLFLIFGNGIGVLLYLLLWIVIPLDGQVQTANLANNVQNGSQEIAAQTRAVGQDLRELVHSTQSKIGLLVGGAMILAGILYLLSNLHWIALNWIDFDLIWPLILIFGGLALLFRRPKGA